MITHCIVKDCTSVWSPDCRITFHPFPQDERDRRAWLSTIVLKVPFSDDAQICSLHFKKDDYDPTTRQLYDKARPFRLASSVVACANMMVCRVCLSMNRKQYSIRKHKLKEMYRELTGLVLTDEEKFPQKVCWECAHRLNSFSRYKSMALRSHKLMQDLLHSKRYLTLRDIKAIDREAHHLTSKLTHATLQYYDVELHDTIEMNKDENQANSNLNQENEEPNTVFLQVKVSPDSEENRQENLDIKFQYIKESEESNVSEASDEDIEEKFECDTAEEVNKIYSKDIEEDSTKETNSSCKREVYNEFTRNLNFVVKDYTFILNNDCSSTVTKKQESNKPSADELKTAKVLKAANRFINGKSDIPDDIKNFTITRLSVDEQFAEMQQRQNSAAYKKSALKCTTCYKAFRDEGTYKSHMLRHTDRCGIHVCPICKLHFNRRCIVKSHCMEAHWYRFNCNLCQFSANASKLATAHEKWHNGVRWECPHCQETFQMPTSYRNHLRINHPSDVVCPLCGDAFVSQLGLRSHKRLKHYGHDPEIPEEGPRCESCDIRFANKDAFERHLVRSARHRTPYDPSKKKVRTPARDLRENIKRKSPKLVPNKEKKWTKDSGPIKCEQCDAELATPRAYGYHFRQHHPGATRTYFPTWEESYMCEICGKMCKNAFFFRDHSYTHGDVKRFKCDVCGKQFYKSVELSAHKRRHTDARHACPTCGKRFIDVGNMNRHINVHLGVKPFTCEWCGKQFSQAQERKSHIQYVHMKQPWPKRIRNRKQNTQVPKSSEATSIKRIKMSERAID